MGNNKQTGNVLHISRGAVLCKKRGNASLSAGRVEEALVFYRRAFALVPGCAGYGESVSIALTRLHYCDEAVRELLRLLARPGKRLGIYARLLANMDEWNSVHMTLRMMEWYMPEIYYHTGVPGTSGMNEEAINAVENYKRRLVRLKKETWGARTAERCERALNSGNRAVAGAMARRLLRRSETRRRGRALQARLMAQTTGNHADALLDTMDVTAMQSPDSLIMRCAAAIVCDSVRDGADTSRATDMLLMALESCRTREDGHAIMEFLADKPSMSGVLLTASQSIRASGKREVEIDIVAEYAALRCGESTPDELRAALTGLNRLFPDNALLYGYSLYFQDGSPADMPHPKALADRFARELRGMRDMSAEVREDVIRKCGFILGTRYSCARDEVLAVMILTRMNDPVAGGILADFVAGNTGNDRVKVIALNALRAMNYTPMPMLAWLDGRIRRVREYMSRTELRRLIKEHGPRVAMRRLCGRPDEDLSELTAAYLQGESKLMRWRNRPALLGAALAAEYLETRGEVNVCERYSRKYELPRRELRMCMNDIGRACFGVRGGHHRRKLY